MSNEPLPHPTLPTPDFAPRQRDDAKGDKSGKSGDAERMIVAVERMDAAARDSAALPDPSFPTEPAIDAIPATPEAMQPAQQAQQDPPVDPDRVPTVSGVVSRLGRAGKFLAALSDKPEPPRAR